MVTELTDAEFFERYAKLVFCKDDRCAWNMGIKEEVFIKHHKDDHPFPADSYRGVCSRPELGLNAEVIQSGNRKRVLATCGFRSDKTLSGHLDFSRFPKGGNIPDPVSGDTAYH